MTVVVSDKVYAQMRAAQQFVGKLFAAYNEKWGPDMDDATIYEWCVECGLLREVEMWHNYYGEGERCINCPGSCDICYRLTDAAEAAIACERK
jgi:hypothetical protein